MNSPITEIEPSKEVLNTMDTISAPRTYNSFLPILIVFAFFTIISCVKLYSDIEARKNIEAARDKWGAEKVRAEVKKEALQGLAQDLVQLSQTSLVAQQIVTDFKIQVRNPNQKAAAPAPTPAPIQPATANTPSKSTSQP